MVKFWLRRPLRVMNGHHIGDGAGPLCAISGRCYGVPSGSCYGPVRRKPTYQEKSFVVSAFCKPRPAENKKWSCSLKS